MSQIKVQSWGRYPAHSQTTHPIYWQDDICTQLNTIAKQHKHTLAFGNGRSYGDSCLAYSGHVLYTHPLNRFIQADWHNGTITAETGVTLSDILNISIPKGWFLPVTPGTKYVTLGGAIANDVHGKNHHIKGTFGCHIRRFGLIRSDHTYLECSPTQNEAFFNATIGGLGLTGIISWVELQLMPIQSSLIATTTTRFNNLNEFIDLCEEFDQSHEYCVAWVDCLANKDHLGRGVFFAGDHAQDGELFINQDKKTTIPFTPPLSMINQVSLQLFNTFYYHKHSAKRIISHSHYDAFFYPLDNLLEWNRIYGPKGFQQYQCIIPLEQAKDTITELLNTISASGKGSFLAVLKKCGSIASPGLLSFPMAGISLALDFPQHPYLETLFSHLDQIVHNAKGRLYPAKDAHISGIDYRQSYPNWHIVEKLRDPALLSKFWHRVTQQ